MPPADLAVLGAAIRTLDPARPSASAVAVRDGLAYAARLQRRNGNVGDRGFACS